MDINADNAGYNIRIRPRCAPLTTQPSKIKPSTVQTFKLKPRPVDDSKAHIRAGQRSKYTLGTSSHPEITPADDAPTRSSHLAIGSTSFERATITPIRTLGIARVTPSSVARAPRRNAQILLGFEQSVWARPVDEERVQSSCTAE
ncbi:hypothetical protein A0H81_11293 [Grifola frondosa]|uniref:Uncharacterized protein n=1 Tax=Grifola frondosa TaxID=5627 RepID=A0A1C7LXL2_GRIFR|nr:hypothetical protein A0H81_11293 [Grifola frondosa]